MQPKFYVDLLICRDVESHNVKRAQINCYNGVKKIYFIGSAILSNFIAAPVTRINFERMEFSLNKLDLVCYLHEETLK